MSNKYLIVDSKVLPDYFELVLKAKELLESSKVEGVSKACEEVGISRSTYYKYKDYVFLLKGGIDGRRAELNILLNHQQGTLKEVLDIISSEKCNILTIHQSLPINNLASLNVLIDISKSEYGIDEVLNKLAKLDDVKKVKLIGME